MPTIQVRVLPGAGDVVHCTATIEKSPAKPLEPEDKNDPNSPAKDMKKSELKSKRARMGEEPLPPTQRKVSVQEGETLPFEIELDNDQKLILEFNDAKEELYYDNNQFALTKQPVEVIEPTKAEAKSPPFSSKDVKAENTPKAHHT